MKLYHLVVFTFFMVAMSSEITAASDVEVMQMATQVTTSFDSVERLITVGCYLIGSCLILCAFYLFGVRRAKEVHSTILIPITLIFLAFGLSEYISTNKISATLFVAILFLLPYGFYRDGARRAAQAKISIWLPIVLIIIGLIFFYLPVLNARASIESWPSLKVHTSKLENQAAIFSL